MESPPQPYNNHRHGKSPKSPAPTLPLKELLLLSPSPLRRSSKVRLADRLDEPAGAPPEAPRRRCRTSRAAAHLGVASPRSSRRSRRRSELDDGEEIAATPKPRKRRQSSKKEKLNLLHQPLKECGDEDIQGCLDGLSEFMSDLVMWRDLAKSSLWFGLGSLFFFSSFFSHGLAFSVFSVISKMGFLFLGLSFFSNSMRQRNNENAEQQSRDYRLKEDDILRVAKLILPYLNLAISKTRELFSGEPSMTLKVAPLLLLGSEYGHLITIWRLCAIGFFLAFTVPKIFSCYAIQISQKVDYLSWGVSEKWANCSHKKKLAASALTAFWNLSTIKTRIFTAFISLVLIRYWREHIAQESEDKEVSEGEEENREQALVLTVPE